MPDPGRAGTLDEVVDGLRLLKVWAGNPSYEAITGRVNAAWAAAGRPPGESARKATVADCLKIGRRRLNTDLVVAVVRSLHPDEGYVVQWRQALRVVGGEVEAASQVRVYGTLPPVVDGFTGRTAELDRLRQALRHGRQNRGVVVVSAIDGMAGVGKTQLALRAGHLLLREKAFERVLFVNLRGFHPDPVQPPADPAAVLDGFLRLLGVPGHRIPHDLAARTAAYRAALVGSRTLVILDNAPGEKHLRPLLPDTPGCSVLATSRRSLTALRPATHLTVDVLTAEESQALLAKAAAGVPVGPDLVAPARIAERCGHLPLALELVAGHIRGASGWTLTDHAERLDERHREGRLDSGVELALDLSYRHLPAAQRRLLRLAALHPGQDLDAHAAAALAGADVAVTRHQLRRLRHDHLLQQSTTGRYVFHDLVRAHAAGRAKDDDRPRDRQAALTRLFGYYLAACTAAMDTLYPAEPHRRPRIPAPGSPAPDLTDPDTARGWLDTERSNLVAVVAHAATRGWPTHATRLAATLFRYLTCGYHADALSIHGHAHQAARRNGDPTGQAHALNGIAGAHLGLSRYGPAAECLERALVLYRQSGDPVGEARVLGNSGLVAARLGRYLTAAGHLEHALSLFRMTSDQLGEARVLSGLGDVEGRLGRHGLSVEHLQQALALCRQTGDRTGEGRALNSLGNVEWRLGRHEVAAGHLHDALALFQQLGDRTGEAWCLDSLGTLHNHRGQPARATQYHQRALAIFRTTGERYSQASALNGLGEAAHTAGRPTDALTHHTAAHTIATDLDARSQQARAHAGIGRAHHALTDPAGARHHYQRALDIYTDLGRPEGDQLHAELAALEGNGDHRR